MKNTLPIVAALCFVFVPQNSRSAAPVPRSNGYQRFIPMPRQPENVTGVPWSGAFALDSKTGQLCKTYDGGLDEKWASLPTCLALFRSFPD